MMMRLSAAAMVVLAIGVTGCSPSEAEFVLPAKVQAVLQRSKETQATYAVYNWNLVRYDKDPVEDWSAEFHSGHLHRVETSRDRIVADCAAGTGSAYSLATGKTTTDPRLALAACGINTNKRFFGATDLGTVETPFGRADRVEVTDSEEIRSYDIRSDGAIVGATIALKKPGKPEVLRQTTLEVSTTLPAANMFDVASLARSYVPDRLKVAPQKAR